MAHVTFIEDAKGDIVDATYYCSDWCAKSDPNYEGWYGCVRPGTTQKCSAEGCTNNLVSEEDN